ncbi:MAG TPA: aspartate aminotransferase family protein [Anaerolineae bacterium]|nr:aspartate aminotransferase family protein [Anaerolineae bacterium]
MNYQEIEDRYDSGCYRKRPITLVRGQSARVWDDEGNEYIDCVGGHGVVLLGHSHPAVADALAKQAARLTSCPGVFHNDVRAQLLERLIELAPKGLDQVFLSNSGAEAVEAAIKFARLSTGRPGIVATMRGFHGRTMGALSATWNRQYRAPFEPLVPGFRHVPFNNVDAVAEAVDEDTAAVLVEPVQGEGGVRPSEPGYLPGLREICDQAGALLITDEVQTGCGRTGRWFAVQHYNVTPDILVLGKGLGGGVPIGATLFNERVAAAIRPGIHGSTFGGNPLACAAALTTLEVIEREGLVAAAAEKGERLLAELRTALARSPRVRGVRGLGLMVGIELRERVTPYLRRLMEAQHVLVLPAGPTVLRLLPPLSISDAELERVVGALEAVLNLP